MCWRNFSVFSLVNKKGEKWVKNSTFFSNGCHFRMCIPKIATTTFFRGKLSKLHKKAQFCMWQLQFSWHKGKQEQVVDPLLCPQWGHYINLITEQPITGIISIKVKYYSSPQNPLRGAIFHWRGHKNWAQITTMAVIIEFARRVCIRHQSICGKQIWVTIFSNMLSNKTLPIFAFSKISQRAHFFSHKISKSTSTNLKSPWSNTFWLILVLISILYANPCWSYHAGQVLLQVVKGWIEHGDGSMQQGHRG